MNLGTVLRPAETGGQYALRECRASNLVAVEVVLEARGGVVAGAVVVVAGTAVVVGATVVVVVVDVVVVVASGFG